MTSFLKSINTLHQFRDLLGDSKVEYFRRKGRKVRGYTLNQLSHKLSKLSWERKVENIILFNELKEKLRKFDRCPLVSMAHNASKFEITLAKTRQKVGNCWFKWITGFDRKQFLNSPLIELPEPLKDPIDVVLEHTESGDVPILNPIHFQIYTTSKLPLPYYKALLENELDEKDSLKFFVNKKIYERFKKLTLDEVESMVVKVEEDYFRKIHIKSILDVNTEFKHEIMKQTLKKALECADNGIVIFPAAERYWSIFLEALQGFSFERIFIRGKDAPEITNLIDTDPLQLAHNLKLVFPKKTISYINDERKC